MTAQAIFTPMAGGLGDILTYYLEGELGHFAALKRAGARTKVIAWCVSDQALPLFAANPNIDVMTLRKFAPVAHMTDCFRDYAQSIEPEYRLMTQSDRASVPWERPQFYLSREEDIVAQDIEAGGPYVAIHPFAGRPERDLVRAGGAHTIVEAAAKHGRVVVLGGDSLRRERDKAIELREEFVSHHTRVLNLVNRASVSLQAHVASRAAKFIGSVSCYNCVAHACGVPALVFGSAANRASMENGAGSIFARMRAARTRIFYLDQPGNVERAVRRFLS